MSAVEALRCQIVQLSAWAASQGALAERATVQGWALPGMGMVTVTGQRVAIAVRPRRWLLLDLVSGAGLASECQSMAGDAGAAVEMSAALNAWQLESATARGILAHGCRLDLDASVFPTGRAAATQIAQVSVVIATLPQCWLLLSPSSTANHFSEWLQQAASAAAASRGTVTASR